MGDRHYSGPETATRVIPWQCNACGNKNVSRFEDGCPGCGAGTPAQAARVQPTREVGLERLREEIVSGAVGEVTADYFLFLAPLTPRARVSVAAALAHYAEQGSPTNDELPRAVSLAWARRLLAAALETLDGPKVESD